METSTSPTKRRALASLDANALSSPKPQKQLKSSTISPFKDRKRPLEDTMTTTASPLPEKKAYFEGDDNLSRSQSPDTSSIFDTSANDSSWATEPEASPRPRALTREQAREKAEILRLRLGLASYKFRTGQTSVPLANLQRKPLPLPRRSIPITRSPTRPDHNNNTENHSASSRMRQATASSSPEKTVIPQSDDENEDAEDESAAEEEHHHSRMIPSSQDDEVTMASPQKRQRTEEKRTPNLSLREGAALL